MAIQYSGIIIQSTFSGASVNSILNGIHTALLNASWVDLPRFRAHNQFNNLPFFSNVGNGTTRLVGGTPYQFLSNATLCPEVQIELLPGPTYMNWATCINESDPHFNAKFGGDVTVATDPNGPAYLYVVGNTVGTSLNNLVCTTESLNFGQWTSSVTYGGGWELISVPTTPGNLQMRVRLVADFVPNVGVVANIYVTSAVEDLVSQPITLNASPTTEYTITADPYQFFIYEQGSAAQLSSASAGTPYLYGTMLPQGIHTVSNPTGTTITCGTLTPHNLSTGQRIHILEAQELLEVASMQISGFPNALGDIQFICENDLIPGDVIQYISGISDPHDGYYSVSNTGSGQFTCDNTYGAGWMAGLNGTCKTVANAINGIWIVTVIDSLTFSLNNSKGSGFPYIADTALFAAPGHIARAIWAFGSDGVFNLRVALHSDNNAQFIALNTSSFNKLPPGDRAAPRFAFTGLSANPLNYSDGCGVLMEPLIAAGTGGEGSDPQIFGQLWDAALVSSSATLDLTNVLDAHQISAYSVDAGSGFPYGLSKQGSLWIVY